MKTGKSLVEFAQAIEANKAAKKDYVADTRQITMQLSGISENLRNVLHVGPPDDIAVLEPTKHCHRQLATWSGIGTRYYEKMRDDSPALLAGNVNHWLGKTPDKGECRRLVRSMDGKARAFLSDQYLRLDNEDVAETTFQVLENVPDIEIGSCDITDKRLYIKALFPRTQADVKVGDAVQSGVVVTNSEIGLGAFNVDPFVHRLVCLNGMVVMVKGLGVRRVHLGPRIAQGAIEYQQDTIAAAAKSALLQCRDAVTTFADPAYFEKQVAVMRAATEGQQIEHPIKAMEVLAKDIGLTENESESILERMLRGGDLSKWGCLNAVTNLANDTESYDRASDLEILGGQILRFPIPQWDRVALAA